MNLLTPPSARRASPDVIGAPAHDNRTADGTPWRIIRHRSQPSSSRACARAASLPGCPESIRDSSVTRSSPRHRGRGRDGAPAATSRLTTLICASARDATWARWVTTRTWRSPATSWSASPRARAAAPPTPASTSSKTMVWGPPSPTSRMASMARASSPPEAARASGCSGSPTLAPSASSTGSPVPPGATRTSRRAPAMASAPRRSPTSRPNAPAARARVGAHGRLGLAPARRGAGRARPAGGPPRLRRRRGRRAGPHPPGRRPSRPCRSSPYLRRSSARQSPPLLHLRQAVRIVLPPLDLVAQRAGHVRQLDRRRGQPLAVFVEGLAARQRPGGAPEQRRAPRPRPRWGRAAPPRRARPHGRRPRRPAGPPRGAGACSSSGSSRWAAAISSTW